MGGTENMSPLFLVMLGLFLLVLVSYLLRATALRRKVREMYGHYDIVNEIGHGSCAFLMVPMVVASLMGDPAIRTAAGILSAIFGLFFLTRGFLIHVAKMVRVEKNDWWWDPVHSGMFLGMAVMYYSHDHLLISDTVTKATVWVTATFYLGFSIYYLKELVADWKEEHPHRRAFYTQSNLSHIVIFGAMFLMAMWPETFMAGCCCR